MSRADVVAARSTLRGQNTVNACRCQEIESPQDSTVTVPGSIELFSKMLRYASVPSSRAHFTLSTSMEVRWSMMEEGRFA